MSSQEIQTKIATRLWKAFGEGEVVPVRESEGINSLEEAYSVQKKIEVLAGMPRAGWKVGMTNKNAVRSLNSEGPATAPMFRPLCHETPAEISVFAHHSPSVEVEYAFRFNRDLLPRSETYTCEEVIDAVDALIPAIEIIGTRFRDGFKGLGMIPIVADLVLHVAFVSGPVITEWRQLDLKSQSVRLVKNGRVESEGSGANVLDGPISVLKWTANHLSNMGEAIKAGQMVTTGTCTNIVPVVLGDLVVADFGDLGKVQVSLVDV